MLEIIPGVVLVLMVLTVVYAAARAAWRLHTDDVEEAGSDGRTFER
jgi:hypothetical protein